MARKTIKKPIKSTKVIVEKKRKKKELPIYAGVQIKAISEKHILNQYTTNESVYYHCSFVDGSWKMVPAEDLKGFIK